MEVQICTPTHPSSHRNALWGERWVEKMLSTDLGILWEPTGIAWEWQMWVFQGGGSPQIVGTLGILCEEIDSCKEILTRFWHFACCLKRTLLLPKHPPHSISCIATKSAAKIRTARSAKGRGTQDLKLHVDPAAPDHSWPHSGREARLFARILQGI